MRITGANQLGDLARDLKAIGDKELRKELLRGIQKAAKPLAKVAAPAAARNRLPRAGGLNEFVATSKFAVRTRTSARNPGVRIVGTKTGHDIKAMDAGKVRHPVRGTNVWVLQNIEPGWWTNGLSDSIVAPPVRKEILAVMDDIIRKIANG